MVKQLLEYRTSIASMAYDAIRLTGIVYTPHSGHSTSGTAAVHTARNLDVWRVYAVGMGVCSSLLTGLVGGGMSRESEEIDEQQRHR
jgi:hypothetical protein